MVCWRRREENFESLGHPVGVGGRGVNLLGTGGRMQGAARIAYGCYFPMHVQQTSMESHGHNLGLADARRWG